MHLKRGVRVGAVLVSAVGLVYSLPSQALAQDCNNNGVDDAVDIADGISQDCDLNAVPDECQSDGDGDGTIDACDECGLQITANDTDEQWSIRQSIISQGNVLWFDSQGDVYLYNGSSVVLLQPRLDNSTDLEAVANFVFALGSGATPDQLLAAWRRGTDFAWIWANDGQGVRPVNYTNPYDAAVAMNPEDVAIADGCIFMLFQAPDANTSSLVKHVYSIDPVSGDATLLTGDFLDDNLTQGTGAEVLTLVTSQCQAAWSWCSQSSAGVCSVELDLHFYDGSTTIVLDTNAWALSFARGRLIYSKPIEGVNQLFLYDTNLPNPQPEQITSFTNEDKLLLSAQTDGRHVAMLVSDAAGQDREIIILGGLALTGSGSQPANNPPNSGRPFQMDRGQLLWTAENDSVIYFDGRAFNTVCSEGWLADGDVAQLRRDASTGDDTEIFLYAGTEPDDIQQPVAPLLVQAVPTGNGEVTVSWSTVLGATAYNVYFARQAGVDPSNYQSLPGGGTVSDLSESPAVVTGLDGDELYYFVVTTIEDSTEGPPSQEVAATPCLDADLDSDGDGTPDCSDACPDDPEKTEPGVCGCGEPDTDTDEDGTPDCEDACPDDPNKTEPGLCGCGEPDTDSDGDGTPDCEDGCPDDPDKTVPGVCGCGVPDIDADGDGVIDCEQTGGDEPEPPDGDGDGCAPGLCGPGVVPLLPALVLGMGLIRRTSRRARR